MSPPPPDRNEDRVELLKPESFEVLLPFERDRPLARDCLDRVVRMDQERAALRDIGVAPLLRLGIGGASDHRFRAIGLDFRNLGGRSDFRHEDARADPEFLSSVCDGRAVIAARSCGAAGRGRGSGEEVVEGAARLERTCRLKAFELQRKRRARRRSAKLSQGAACDGYVRGFAHERNEFRRRHVAFGVKAGACSCRGSRARGAAV